MEQRKRVAKKFTNNTLTRLEGLGYHDIWAMLRHLGAAGIAGSENANERLLEAFLSIKAVHPVCREEMETAEKGSDLER